MRNSRKVVGSGIISAVLAISAAGTAVSGTTVTDTSQSSKQEKVENVFLTQHQTEAKAGERTVAADAGQEDTQVTASVELESAMPTVDPILKAEDHFFADAEGTEIQGYVDTMTNKTAVSILNQKAVVNQQLTEAQEEQKRQEEAAKAADPWYSKLMANVEESLNVRQDASEESEVVGKLYKGAAADIEDSSVEGWIKIKSGNVEGYVKSDYCVTGQDAKALAMQVCTTYATVKEDGIRIRSQASTDSEIRTVLTKDQKLTVDTGAQVADGWIAVKCDDGQTAYIAADYVDVNTDIKTAMTLEEEQQMIAEQEATKKAAEEKAAAEAAKEVASSNSSGSSSQAVSSDSGISVSVDDVTLLSAIIYCEAGGEPYEGQLAVGAVVVNRVQSKAYPNSISAVIYQKGQFTPAASGKLAKVLASGKGSQCRQAALEALGGKDNTGGALSFHSGKGSGTVIGTQTFY